MIKSITHFIIIILNQVVFFVLESNSKPSTGT